MSLSKRPIIEAEKVELIAASIDDSFSDAQRRTAARRYLLIAHWNDAVTAGRVLGFKETKGTAQYLLQLLIRDNRKLSRGTLFNWQRRYQWWASARQEPRPDGLIRLMDRRGVRAASSS